MPNDLKEVRILLVGECKLIIACRRFIAIYLILIFVVAGVGKSSLILSLVSEQFIDELDNSIEIPKKLEPIVIPAEVTLENVPGVIIDYSKREQNEKDLLNEIKRVS